MVVDHGKPSPVRARAVDPPIRIATIDLTVLMSVADDVLDLKPAQASIAQAKLNMVGPNKVLDLHGARAYASAPRDPLPQHLGWYPYAVPTGENGAHWSTRQPPQIALQCGCC